MPLPLPFLIVAADYLREGASESLVWALIIACVGQLVFGLIGLIKWYPVVNRFIDREYPAHVLEVTKSLASLTTKVDHIDGEVGRVRIDLGKLEVRAEELGRRIAKLEDRQ